MAKVPYKPKGPNPEQYAAQGSEHAHQVALFMWANHPDTVAKYPVLDPKKRRLFAIPNGGERHPAVAAKLKAEGVRKGVVDLFLRWAVGEWHGLFIEMKKPGEKPTKEQLEFMEDARVDGYGAICCDSWESARDTIIMYLEWKV